jgi:hypothetical protein
MKIPFATEILSTSCSKEIKTLSILSGKLKLFQRISVGKLWRVLAFENLKISQITSKIDEKHFPKFRKFLHHSVRVENFSLPELKHFSPKKVVQ